MTDAERTAQAQEIAAQITGEWGANLLPEQRFALAETKDAEPRLQVAIAVALSKAEARGVGEKLGIFVRRMGEFNGLNIELETRLAALRTAGQALLDAHRSDDAANALLRDGFPTNRAFAHYVTEVIAPALDRMDAALAAAPGGEQEPPTCGIQGCGAPPEHTGEHALPPIAPCPGCEHPPHGGECRRGEGFPPSWCGCLISAVPAAPQEPA